MQQFYQSKIWTESILLLLDYLRVVRLYEMLISFMFIKWFLYVTLVCKGLLMGAGSTVFLRWQLQNIKKKVPYSKPLYSNYYQALS
jgi:hypothetical protein